MTRRNGRCVICGTVGKLTEDHVPPRALVPATRVEIAQLIAACGGRTDASPPARPGFQSPRFHSLCALCNNTRLGAHADPALIAVAIQLTRWVTMAWDRGVTLPSSAVVDVDGPRVGRAVVGHLLAAEERSNPLAPLAEGGALHAMRAFFLGPTPDTPPFRLFLWPFLGSDITIVRGFSLARVLGDGHGPVIGDVLKFFPLAFWLVHAVPEDVMIPFAEIPLTHVGISHVTIPLRALPPLRWPEMPGRAEVVGVASERTFVARRAARRP